MANDRDNEDQLVGVGKNPWPPVALVLGILSLALVAWVFYSIFEIPRGIARSGHQTLVELQDLARAFTEGTVTHEFVSYTTSLSGTTFLQVATLEQVESFDLEDSLSTLWGVVELPSVKVRATAPVTFTYYLDLAAPWNLELKDGRVRVSAPNLRWNKPAVDVSRLRYEVLRGSLLRDEAVVLKALTREMTGRTGVRAIENVDLVRETARRQTADFVRNWLLQQYPEADQLPIEVVFSDEEGTEAPPRPLVTTPPG
ncbi:MAG: hypothetical protein K8J08_21135 [Thermoanaerobaculia bacterium]|nr:hypothetical protein [Thermoanaerobaculia bacterium]